MRKSVLAGGLVLAAIWMQGCISIHSERGTHPPAPSVRQPKDITIQEIDAVSKLSFDGHKHTSYKSIAQRDGLSSHAQVHLVEAVFRHLSFENMKVDVLLVLITNPCFSPAAKGAILDRLGRISFENHKVDILQAINQRQV